VAEAIGIEADGAFYQRVAATVDKLMTRLVKLKTEDGHIVTHWLQKARYYTGMGYFDFWFDESMRPYLLNLDQYVKYDRKNVLQFKSSYSFRIYEILNKWQGANHSNQLSVKVDQLRDVLGIRKTEYQTFGNFNNRVIKIAQRELTEQSNITFEYHTWKEGRATAGIVFTIKDNVPTGKPDKKKRGRPKKVDESIQPTQDLFSIMEEDSIYPIEIKSRLEALGIRHLQKFKDEGINGDHWLAALAKQESSGEAGKVIETARDELLKEKSVTKRQEKDLATKSIIESNKAFIKANQDGYNFRDALARMDVDSYFMTGGATYSFSDPEFIKKVEPLKNEASLENREGERRAKKNLIGGSSDQRKKQDRRIN
jgi:hypothetical protein